MTMPRRFHLRPSAAPPAALLLASVLSAGALAGTARAGPSADSSNAAAGGQWNARTGDRPNTLWLDLRMVRPDGGSNEIGHRVPIAELKGLPEAALRGPGSNVVFDIERDAGTLHCRGEFSNGIGAGLFDVALNPSYADQLARRGVGRPTPDQQVKLVIADARLEVLEALAANRYPTPDITLFTRLATHEVDVEYIQGMSKAGYRFGSVGELIRARDHGVDPQFVGDMAKAGYSNVDFDVLLRARDHGADADFISDMAEAGYKKVPLEALIRARDHGVDGGYADALSKAGFGDLPLSTLIHARDHGVTPGYARRIKESRPGVSIQEVISMRDRGTSE